MLTQTAIGKLFTWWR